VGRTLNLNITTKAKLKLISKSAPTPGVDFRSSVNGGEGDEAVVATTSGGVQEVFRVIYIQGKHHQCPLCPGMEGSCAKLVNHLKESHGKSVVHFVCPKCGEFSSLYPKTVTLHSYICVVDEVVQAVPDPVVVDPKALVTCELCGERFIGKGGLGVHRNARHPAEANAMKPVRTVGLPWRVDELRALALAAIRLEAAGQSRTLFVEKLREEFGKVRKITEYYSVRKTDRYRLIVAECRAENNLPLRQEVDDDILVVESDDSDDDLGNQTVGDEVVIGGDDGGVGNGNVEGGIGGLRRCIAEAGVLLAGTSAAVYAQAVLLGGDGFNEHIAALERNLSASRRNGTGGRRTTKSAKPYKDNHKGRREQRYRTCQLALGKNFSTTCKRILDGTDDFNSESDVNPTVLDIDQEFRSRFEAAPQEEEAYIPTQPEAEGSLAPFTPDEVLLCLKGMKKLSAPGPDGLWTVEALSTVDARVIAITFNCWLLKSDVPAMLKKYRTILIHKSGDKNAAKNYRPITIGSMWLRLFTRCLALRWGTQYPISVRQKAFVPVDGCWENVSILRDCIKNAYAQRSPFYALFLDLAKAFDTVQHSSVIRAMALAGFDPQARDLVANMYSGCVTTISSGGGPSTAPVTMLTGVKQGDPLSPFLFNLVLNELVKNIENCDHGAYLSGGLKCGVLAFADDLVLLADEEFPMREIKTICERFFGARHLTFNAGKCQSLSMRPYNHDHARSMIVGTKSVWKISGKDIPPATFTSLAKYLGVRMDPRGRILIPIKVWTESLQRVAKSPLKPVQKWRCITEVLIPRMRWSLRLASSGRVELRRCDDMIREALKGYAHLPICTPTAWFYTSQRDAGAGVSQLECAVTASIVKASSHALSSSDDIVRAAAVRDDSKVRKTLSFLPGVVITPAGVKDHFRRKNEALLGAKQQSGLHEARASSVVSMSAFMRGRLVKGAFWCHALKLMTGVAPCRVNLWLRGVEASPICRRCGKVNENMLHALNDCEFSHSWIVRRHNHAVDKLAKAVESSGWRVWKEQAIRHGASYQRPDLICVKDSTCLIVDVTIPYERSTEYLNRRIVEKAEKYRPLCEAVRTFVRSEGCTGVTKVESLGFVVGSTGTVPGNSMATLKSLLIRRPAQLAQQLFWSVLTGSVNTWLHFLGAKDLNRNRGLVIRPTTFARLQP
jgi:hypothetical protein